MAIKKIKLPNNSTIDINDARDVPIINSNGYIDSEDSFTIRGFKTVTGDTVALPGGGDGDQDYILASLLDLDGYLPLNGGTMTADAAISWGTNDRTDWGTIPDGIRVLSSTDTTSGAPTQYAVGMTIKSRYSFSLASRGGTADSFYFRSGLRNWYEVYHSGNLTQSVVTGLIGSTTYAPYNADGYLPLSGGTLSGSIIFGSGYPAIKFDVDTSRARAGLNWLNTSGDVVGSILMHNTAKAIYINATGAASIFSDTVGKYSLKIGENSLTYNTYNIWHSGNFSPNDINWRVADLTSGSTKWIVVKTTLAITGNHRFIFHVIGNTYATAPPILSVIQGVNSSTGSTFIDHRAVNSGRNITWKIAAIDGYICLYTQAINGVSMRFNCQSGASNTNRIDTITLVDTEPTPTYSVTPVTHSAIFDNLSQTLTGNKTFSGTTTFSGEPVLNNAISLRAVDTNGANWNVLQLSSSNNLLLGYGSAAQGYNTTLYGNNIYFRYGTNRQIAATIDSSGNTNIDGLTTITKATQQPLVVKRDAAGATQYTAVGFQTADTNLGAIGMNAVGEAFVREGATGTYHRVYTSKNITISSSEPTSSDGSDGDIWIVI